MTILPQMNQIRSDCATPFEGGQTERFFVKGMGISAVMNKGVGEPLLFIHGNSACKEVWQHQLALLGQLGMTFLAIDLPGHGGSDNATRPEAIYTFPGYASVIDELLGQLGWGSLGVVGWSLGGHIGLELLAINQKISSLLIVGTPPVSLSAKALQEAFFDGNDMRLAGKSEFSHLDAVTYGAAMLGGRAHLTPNLLASIKRTDGAARHFMYASALAGVGADERIVVQESHKPICVIHGQVEPFVRLDYLRSLHYRNLWEREVHVIPGAGHAPHWERPCLFNEILLRFLRRSCGTH